MGEKNNINKFKQTESNGKPLIWLAQQKNQKTK